MKPYKIHFILLALICSISILSNCSTEEEEDSSLEFSIATTDVPVDSEVKFVNSSVGFDNFLWDFGDGNSSKLAEPTHVYSTVQTFTIRLTGTNVNTGEVFTVELEIPVVAFKNLRDTQTFLDSDRVFNNTVNYITPIDRSHIGIWYYELPTDGPGRYAAAKVQINDFTTDIPIVDRVKFQESDAIKPISITLIDGEYAFLERGKIFSTNPNFDSYRITQYPIDLVINNSDATINNNEGNLIIAGGLIEMANDDKNILKFFLLNPDLEIINSFSNPAEDGLLNSDLHLFESSDKQHALFVLKDDNNVDSGRLQIWDISSNLEMDKHPIEIDFDFTAFEQIRNIKTIVDENDQLYVTFTYNGNTVFIKIDLNTKEVLDEFAYDDSFNSINGSGMSLIENGRILIALSNSLIIRDTNSGTNTIVDEFSGGSAIIKMDDNEFIITSSEVSAEIGEKLSIRRIVFE